MPYQQIFEGSITGYDVKIILSADGIIFFLWHPLRRRHYQAKIPYQLTGKSKEIQTIFTNLDEFYLYITHFSQDWDRISIDNNGRITIKYQLVKYKSKIPPTIIIDTEILLPGHQIRNQNKIQSELGNVKKQNLFLQNKINQLMQLNDQNKKDMEELKRMLEKKEHRYNEASESESEDEKYNDHEPKKGNKKYKKKYSVISGSKSGIKQLNATINQLKKQIQAITTHVATGNNGKIKTPLLITQPYLQNQDDQDYIFGKKLEITVDRNNQYLQNHFKIEGNKITKIKCYARIQLLSKETIPPMGRHYFVMYIEKISFMLFSLGIVAQRRRNYKNSHKDKDLISYFAKTGAIWENEDCRSGGPLIPNGVQIRVVVDTIKWTVKWYMDKQQIASTVIGEHLRKQRLVAYLEFNYENDVVYWNQRTFKANQ